jgi:hypothetical protein
MLASLRRGDRELLGASIAESETLAGRVSADIHEIVDLLNIGGAEPRAEVVDENKRVKGIASLARKFLPVNEARGVGVERFLETTNDRVRFSIQLPEKRYGNIAATALGLLGQRGYEVSRVSSFWSEHGRHNGVNVTLSTTPGINIEIQFPTLLSREVGYLTHDSYETVRMSRASALDRIEAFLDILSVNKSHGLAERIPENLSAIPNLESVDTTFVRWVTHSAPEVWREYLTAIGGDGRILMDALAERGLTPDDIPGIYALDLEHGLGLRLSSGSPREEFEGSDQPHRLPGSAAGSASRGDVERPATSMDLRTGDSGGHPVRRHRVPGSDGTGGPDHGGADSP